MLTLEDIKRRLDTTNLPVVYYAFPESTVPPLPWIVYFETGERSFAADGGVYYAAKQIRVELYTSKKDVQTEQLLETALNDVFYTKTESYLNEEKCFMIIYEIEV